jgi:hypothetical protein
MSSWILSSIRNSHSGLFKAPFAGHVYQRPDRVCLWQQMEAALFHEGRRQLLPSAHTVEVTNKVWRAYKVKMRTDLLTADSCGRAVNRRSQFATLELSAAQPSQGRAHRLKMSAGPSTAFSSAACQSRCVDHGPTPSSDSSSSICSVRVSTRPQAGNCLPFGCVRTVPKPYMFEITRDVLLSESRFPNLLERQQTSRK